MTGTSYTVRYDDTHQRWIVVDPDNRAVPIPFSSERQAADHAAAMNKVTGGVNEGQHATDAS